MPFRRDKHTATFKHKTNKIDELHKKSMNYTIPTVEPYKSCIFEYYLVFCKNFRIALL